MNMKTYIVLFVIIVLGIALWAFTKKDEVAPVTPVSTLPATVSTVSLTEDNSSAAAINAGTKTIVWRTSNYPQNVGVNINLIKKISDSPQQYELVRVLATDTANDGSESWTPALNEHTPDLYVEVVCSSAYQFNAGCSLSGGVMKVE